jgi:hypothetical protein
VLKKHLSGLGNAQAGMLETMIWFAPACEPVISTSALSYCQIMLFPATAAHFTGLLHVHLHIITSLPLKKMRCSYHNVGFAVNLFFGFIHYSLISIPRSGTHS